MKYRKPQDAQAILNLKSTELAGFLIHTHISTTSSSPRKESIIMSIYFKNIDLSKIIKKSKKPRRRKLINPFPIKLYQMLQEAARNGKGVGHLPAYLSKFTILSDS
jgi:hypothetical protein